MLKGGLQTHIHTHTDTDTDRHRHICHAEGRPPSREEMKNVGQKFWLEASWDECGRRPWIDVRFDEMLHKKSLNQKLCVE